MLRPRSFITAAAIGAIIAKAVDAIMIGTGNIATATATAGAEYAPGRLTQPETARPFRYAEQICTPIRMLGY